MEGYAEQGARTDSTDQIGFGGARRNRKKRRGLTVFQLKVIGAVALALSAGSTTIVPLFFGSDTNNMTSLTAMVLSEVVSWFAIPIYAWLLVQGFRETHSRVAYGLQLFILAVACEVPSTSPHRIRLSTWARRIPFLACSLRLLCLPRSTGWRRAIRRP